MAAFGDDWEPDEDEDDEGETPQCPRCPGDCTCEPEPCPGCLCVDCVCDLAGG